MQQIIYNTPRSKTSSDFDSVDTTHMNTRSHLAGLGSTAASMTPSRLTLNGLRAYDINDLDAFLGMLPDDLQDEWFEAIGQSDPDPRNAPAEMTSTRHFFNFS